MNRTLDNPREAAEARAAEERFVTPVTAIRQEADGSYVIEAEMPGVSKEGIEISVDQNELTITGRRAFPVTEGRAVYREIRRANFRRVFELDGSIDRDRITARIENGLLRVTLPLAEQVKPRKIVVEG